MLAKRLIVVELFWSCELFGFGNGRAEALPRNHCGDRTIGIMLAVACGDQRGTDASVEPDLFIDRPRIRLGGAGMVSLGLAEHRADQTIEQVDGLVGQDRGDVQCCGDQGRVPALPLVAGHMLDSGAAGLANELCQTRLVDKMTAARLDADGAHMLQPLDQAKHAGGRGCLRHLPQPSEPTQTAFVPALSERIEALALLGRKRIGQPAVCLSPRTVAEVSAQPLQRHGRWDDDTALTARLHHQFGQKGKPIVLDRWGEQHAFQRGSEVLAERAQSKLLLAIDDVTLPVPIRGEIFVDDIRKNVDLISNERQQSSGRPLTGTQRAARQTQITEHQCVAETVVIPTTTPDRYEISFGEREVAHQLTLLCRRLEQLCYLDLAQSLPARHSCLPEPWFRQTSRSAPASRSKCCV